MYKIGLAHLGKSKKFEREVSSVDNDFQTLVINLSRNNPDDTFYCLQCRGDASNKRMFPHQNVVFIPSSKDADNFINNDPGLDFFVMYTGVSAPGVNIDNMTVDKTDPTKRQRIKFEMVLRYCSPILKWLNHSKVPYIALSNDPRNGELRVLDLHHRPFKHFAQAKWSVELPKMISYDDRTKILFTSNVEYWPIEQIKLCDIDTSSRDDYDKHTMFGIICNEGSEEYERQGVNQRWPILKDWILSTDNKDIEIYGKWHEKYLEQDSRMKGSIPFLELQEKIKHWKYSLCIPIKDGWVTGKYCELVQHKIVPFLYPGYDSDKLIEFPEILRLQKPEDLWERIQFLEENPDEYEALWKQLDTMFLNEDILTGKFVNEFIYSFITDDYQFEYVPPKYKKWTDFFDSAVLKF